MFVCVWVLCVKVSISFHHPLSIIGNIYLVGFVWISRFLRSLRISGFFCQIPGRQIFFDFFKIGLYYKNIK